MSKAFTGRHMATILVLGFGVVIGANLVMARLATSTFGGVVVDNSYVASQKFNGWLEQAEQSRALGWDVKPMRRQDGRIAVSLGGVPSGASVRAVARHPLGRLPDRPLAFAPAADGVAVSADALPPGRWTLRVEIEAAGKVWRGEEDLR